MQKLFTGTSGWSYNQWKPDFFPQEIKAGDYLGYYSHIHNSVEVNNSFYRPPSPVMIAKWRASVPPDFIFSVKAWQEITHGKRLKNVQAELEFFYNIIASFADNLGPILFQLPPSLKFDAILLEDFFAQLPPHKTSIEFRNNSWYNDKTAEILKKYNVAMCLAHITEWTTPLIATADFTYIRLHGAASLYEGSYDADFIKRLSHWLQKAGRAENYLYFNNTKTGTYALENAKLLAFVKEQDLT